MGNGRLQGEHTCQCREKTQVTISTRPNNQVVIHGKGHDTERVCVSDLML